MVAGQMELIPKPCVSVCLFSFPLSSGRGTPRVLFRVQPVGWEPAGSTTSHHLSSDAVNAAC